MIQTTASLVRRATAWRANGRRLGLTNGVFDVFHVGHLASLLFAADHCDRLIVAIDDDASARLLKGPGRPLNSARHRATIVAALSAVDAVIIFASGELDGLIEQIAPDVLVKGDEYRGRPIIGARHVPEVLFAPMTAGISSTAIIKRLETV